MRRSILALSVAAAMLAGPALAFRMPAPWTAPSFLLEGGKGKRKHRMAGTGGGRRGNACNNGRRVVKACPVFKEGALIGHRKMFVPHQGRQERLRRLIGGFYSGHKYGMTKARLIAKVEEATARGGNVQQVREAVLEGMA